MDDALSVELLAKYRDFVYDRIGLYYSPDKMEILGIKLKKLTFAKNYSLGDYYRRLIGGDAPAFSELVEEITVGHTFFFREKSHLEYLARDIRKKGTIRPVIWCAASSTGEEPYSMAIHLIESGILDFTIVASDVNQSALETMDKGIYGKGQLKYTSPELMKKYFRQIGTDEWLIKPNLSRFLKIKRLNLHEPIEFERKINYAFCRNVMIYFDEAGRQSVLENIIGNLLNDGLLFVGHAEAMLTLPKGLRKDGTAVFRRVQ